ncbi:MAG: HAMP domain-containing histidine kinase [Deltaproteobacteria bacterium]|nr:MAG: HAMP domain-containing histidine kinase [Deltaproteobacteria bacterium]
MGRAVNRRRVLAVLAAALALLVAINALIYSLYRSDVRAVTGTLDDRLSALGVTSASWLASIGDAGAPAGAPVDRSLGALLDALVRDNRLEDAYLIDPALRVLAGVRTPAGAPLNLLRVDEDRLARAFAGEASVGTGYSVANATVEAAYFPVRRAGSTRVLTLEAGAEYHAPAVALRRTYLVAVGLTALAAVVFAVGLGLALRALERARLAHGRAERMAAVGQMAAMVAHEVRNPLGILRGQIELARERLAPAAPPREQERFVEMLGEVDRLNRLTEEFLGLTRDVALDPGDVDLGALARAVADEVRLLAPGADITASGALTVRADAAKLRQALLNLVLNATQIGGPAVVVAIEVADDGERARLSVIDDGPGVPAELAARLFQPFVTARAGGTGLGLTAARRIAERHGGTLVLESRPGARGARFSIYLPRRPA